MSLLYQPQPFGLPVHAHLRYTLLGIPPPGSSPADAGLLPPGPDARYAPPLPAGQAPPGSLQAQQPGAPPGQGTALGAAAPAAAGPGKDIFSR